MGNLSSYPGNHSFVENHSHLSISAFLLLYSFFLTLLTVIFLGNVLISKKSCQAKAWYLLTSYLVCWYYCLSPTRATSKWYWPIVRKGAPGDMPLTSESSFIHEIYSSYPGLSLKAQRVPLIYKLRWFPVCEKILKQFIFHLFRSFYMAIIHILIPALFSIPMTSLSSSHFHILFSIFPKKQFKIVFHISYVTF